MYLKTNMTSSRVSKTSCSSGFLGDFLRRISQYFASNSGDLEDVLAIFVTTKYQS